MLTRFYQGMRAFWVGVSWLLQRPFYLSMLLIPLLIGAATFGLTLWAYVSFADTWIEALLFRRPESSWLWIALYYVCYVLAWLGLLVLAGIWAMLVTNIASAPVYEAISTAIERDILGQPSPQLGWGATLRLIWEETKKALFIVLVSLTLLVVPGLQIVTGFLCAVLISWDLYDYPLSRRGWSLKRRLRFARVDWAGLAGFSLWLCIPGLQVVLIPLAVAGATLLSLGQLERNKAR